MAITKFSHSPGVTVDEDGVIQEEINPDNGNPTGVQASNAKSVYSSQVQKIVRDVIPGFGEEIVQGYIGGEIFAGQSYDIDLPSGKRVEVKTGRIGSSTSVRKIQLESYSERDVYALLFYEMINNSFPPSYYVHEAIQGDFPVGPEYYLKSSVRWRILYLIQRPSIVHFFNTSNLRVFYNSGGQAYKSLSRRSAQKIFDDNPDDFPREKSRFKTGTHEIEVFKLGKTL